LVRVNTRLEQFANHGWAVELAGSRECSFLLWISIIEVKVLIFHDFEAFFVILRGAQRAINRENVKLDS